MNQRNNSDTMNASPQRSASRRWRITGASFIAAFSVLLACQTATKPKPTVTPGIVPNPPRLAYLCVSPGCEESQTVEITVRGTRRVAIKRVLMGGGGAADFSFTPSEMPPFIVGGGSAFTVDVKYKPTGAPAPGEANLLITYTDASAEESPDRLAPGELSIPLVRRIVGEPLLTVKPDYLRFGVVAVGEEKKLSARVSNEGFGNQFLQIANVDAGIASIAVELPALPALGPDAGFDMGVSFRPSKEAYLKTTVSVIPTSSSVPEAMLTVEGTSLTQPKIAIEPAEDVDFGLLPKGKSRAINRRLINQGGKDLTISSISFNDPLDTLKLLMPMMLPITLKPLESTPLTINVEARAAGEVMATVQVSSNDPVTPTLSWKVIGTIGDPQVQLTPTVLNFGNPLPDGGYTDLPSGWGMSRRLEISNSGFGPLTVKNVSIVSGGSNQFMFSPPVLPVVLNRGERIGVEFQFNASTVSKFSAEVSVETDDTDTPFAYAQLRAGVGACGPATCPIANGTPNCSTAGVCGIGMCNTGFYDADKNPATGCECAEIGTDPGADCPSSYYAGNLHDDPSSGVSFRGVLPESNDVDLIVVHGEDTNSFCLFCDRYDIKIRVDSPDPGVRMCVYTHKQLGHSSECYFTDETCPGDRSFRDDGNLGADDDADYIIKVFRAPNSAPSCAPYTIFMSNAR